MAPVTLVMSTTSTGSPSVVKFSTLGAQIAARVGAPEGEVIGGAGARFVTV